MKHSSYHVEQPDFKNTRALTWKYMKLFMDMGLKNSPVALVGLRDRPHFDSTLKLILDLNGPQPITDSTSYLSW